MILSISQEFFEHVVPGFQSCGGQIFERLQVYLEEAEGLLVDVIGPGASEYLTSEVSYTANARAFVCLRAARMAIPQLDIVLTQTGFGIVSTNNVAPASRDRIAALTEQIRQAESRTFDLVFRQLALTPWRQSQSAATLISSILWSASICRGNGITLEDATVYQDEYLRLFAARTEAETALAGIISTELYNALVAALPVGPDNTHLYRIHNLASAYLRCHIMHSSDLSAVTAQLQLYLDNHADDIPEYRESSVYKAKSHRPSRNDKKNPFYFW